MKTVIFDIDGCISDDRHRAHLLPTSKDAKNGDFDAYHQQLFLDKPINQEVLKNFIHSDIKFRIVFVTARPENFRCLTRVWIRKNFGTFEYILLMRPKLNFQKSPDLKVAMIAMAGISWNEIAAAFDDRSDVLAQYEQKGVANTNLLGLPVSPIVKKTIGVPAILESMAETYKERNKVYGDNYKLCSEIMKVMFPSGVSAEIAHSDVFGLFYMIIGKMTRFSESKCAHIDSIHDIAVYAAMIENCLAGDD